MNPAPPPPNEGWYPDPYHRYEHRWFNGLAWTGDVSNNGQRLIDPYGADPSLPAVAYGAYGTGAYGAGPMPARRGSATASIVLGALAILLTWIPILFVVGVILAIIGIFMGFASRRSALTTGQPTSSSTVGLVFNFIALGLAAVGIWLSVVFVNASSAFAYPGPFEASVDSCRVTSGVVTVTGSVTNRSTSTHSYTVYVQLSGVAEISRPEPIDEVNPDESGDFTVIILASSLSSSDSPNCEATVQVFGPLPFGLEMSPPN